MFAGLSIGLVELISPEGIATVAIMLSLVRKRRHILAYIIASFVTYYTVAIAIFIGVDRFLLAFIDSLRIEHRSLIAVIELVLGAIFLTAFIYLIFYAIRVAQKKVKLSFEGMLHIKSVNPAFLVLFGIGQTFAMLPSCVPLFAYIGVLAVEHATFPQAAALLALYCFFGSVSALLTYVLSYALNGERFEKFIKIVKNVFDYLCLIALPILTALITAFFLWFGIKDLIV